MKHFRLFIIIVAGFALFACQKTKKALTIMPIGDSITQGKANGDSITELSYRYWLWEKLDSAGYKVDFLGSNNIWFREDRKHPLKPPVSRYTSHVFDRDHESFYGINTHNFLHGGFTHDSVTYPSFAERIKPYSPDIALIHLGTNDVEKDSAESVNNLEEIINVLYNRNPAVAVILAKLNTPWKSFINMSVDSIVAHERSLHPGLKIRTVDMASGWVNRPDLPETMTIDWAHPNTRGQKIMATQWFRAIESLDDTIPPAFAPEISMRKTSDTTLLVSWTSATDNKWVEGYNVYLNSQKVNWRYSEGESHDIQSIALVPGTHYVIEGKLPAEGSEIAISACDYGNNCTMSKSVEVEY